MEKEHVTSLNSNLTLNESSPQHENQSSIELFIITNELELLRISSVAEDQWTTSVLLDDKIPFTIETWSYSSEAASVQMTDHASTKEDEEYRLSPLYQG